MMNKSLRVRRRESSRKLIYGFQRPLQSRSDRCEDFRLVLKLRRKRAKKEPPFPAALKLITGRRQTEWTGATRCPNEDDFSHRRESLINRKRTVLFSFRLPCRPLADCWSSLRKQGPIATGGCD